MLSSEITKDSLVCYRSQPARVVAVGAKIEIELADGDCKRVRNKDVRLLHPGPLHSLGELEKAGGEVEEAWDLVAGEQVGFTDLAELIHGEFSPASAWATWNLICDDLLFTLEGENLRARGSAEVAELKAERQARLAARTAWREFLDRIGRGHLEPCDAPHLGDVEMLAEGRRDSSRVLRDLGRQESPETAHALLLKLGHWSADHNPHPSRLGVATEPTRVACEPLTEPSRRDLGQLAAFAIDDPGNNDPDDAISWDGEQLWVHIADVASRVAPDSGLDGEARQRGANLYLPDRVAPMLPESLTHELGLGLSETSPALSLAIRLDEEGAPMVTELLASRIRVRRLSYETAPTQVPTAVWEPLMEVTGRYRSRRLNAGAVELALPEVRIRVRDGEVELTPIDRSTSRQLVAEAMLMAGEAAARLARAEGLALPFISQEANSPEVDLPGLAGAYARRRGMKPSRVRASPERHDGLGLDAYTRATSPLRRYSDLLVHQQLAAWRVGAQPMAREAVQERASVAEQAAGRVRRAERLSNRHWTLVYLMQNAGWRGSGVVVQVEERRTLLFIPELALEYSVSSRKGLTLNEEVGLSRPQVDLPRLETSFRLD